MKALITGISGQDGSYLAEYLLKNGYEVHGIVTNEKIKNPIKYLSNLSSIIDRIKLYGSSMYDYDEVENILTLVNPSEIYHLASSSFVDYNFQTSDDTISKNFLATKNLFTAIKYKSPGSKVYFAGSSEMFGDCDSSPQNEKTPFNPRSIYGLSKLSSYYLARYLRKHDGLFISTGLLYNHESPRRGSEFVTRKISLSVAKIHLGHKKEVTLGNLRSLRDWGYAPEYVIAMNRMLTVTNPDDFIIATGVLHSVEDFLKLAFDVVNLDYSQYTQIDESFFRRTEEIPLCGDYSKARMVLDWSPQKNFESLVEEMVISDIKLLKSKP